MAEPAPAKSGVSRLGLPWIVVMVLVVLLVAGGIFGALKLSSTNNNLSKSRTQLNNAQTQLRSLQSQLSTDQATISSQSSQIKGYKTCLNDLSALGIATRNNDLPAAQTAAGAVQRDCIPLGIG